MSDHERKAVMRGIIISASYLVTAHDLLVYAKDLLAEHDITEEKAYEYGIDEYDIEKLEGLFVGD